MIRESVISNNKSQTITIKPLLNDKEGIHFLLYLGLRFKKI